MSTIQKTITLPSVLLSFAFDFYITFRKYRTHRRIGEKQGYLNDGKVIVLLNRRHVLSLFA